MPYRFVERKLKLGQKTQQMLWYIGHECGGEYRICITATGSLGNGCIVKCNKCGNKLVFYTPRTHYACVSCQQEVSNNARKCLNVKCLTNIERVKL